MNVMYRKRILRFIYIYIYINIKENRNSFFYILTYSVPFLKKKSLSFIVCYLFLIHEFLQDCFFTCGECFKYKNLNSYLLSSFLSSYTLIFLYGKYF